MPLWLRQKIQILLWEVGFIFNNKIRDILVEIGGPQNFVADSEYSFDIGRLDVV